MSHLGGAKKIKEHTTAETSVHEPERRPRSLRRRMLRAACWAMLGMVALVGTAIFGAIYMTGRTVVAPEWVHVEIEARVNAQLGGGEIRFGALEVMVNEGWRPTARLRDVQLKDPQGFEIVSFSEAEVNLAMRPLLQGQVLAKDVSLSGVIVTLQRDSEGKITLRGGTELSRPEAKATDISGLLRKVDESFNLPGLRRLRNVDLRAVTLSYEDTRIDRVWTVDGGRMRLTREGEDLRVSADVAVLSGGSGVATIEANYDSKIGEKTASFGVNIVDLAASDIAPHSPVMAWLEVLRAPISGALRSGVRADGSLAPLNATLQIGAGVLQPTEETKPVPFSAARSYFTFDAREQLIDFAEISVESDWLTVQGQGQAYLGGLESSTLEDLVAQVQLSTLTFNPDTLFDTPINLSGADMDFRLTFDPFQVSLGSMLLRDEERSVQVSGALRADPNGWWYSADAQLDEITPERVLAFWPEQAAASTRTWVANNVLGGTLTHLDFAMRGAPNEPPTTFFSFDYEDASVQFLKTMPPITQAKGNASMLSNRFVASVDSGLVVPTQGGAVDVAGSSFIIPNILQKGGTRSVVELQTESSITAALTLLNAPNLEVMDKAGLDPALAEGRVAMTGSLAIPLSKTLKTSDITYKAQAQLRDVSTSQLIPDQTLRAKTLAVAVDQTRVEISGDGTIGNVPFNAAWTQAINTGSAEASQVVGQVELSQSALDTFNIGLPDGSVSGAGQAQIEIGLPVDGAPTIILNSDLRGLGLNVPQLGWTKSRRQSGRLELSGTLGARPEVTQLELQAAGLTTTGNITLSDAGGLARAQFDRLRVGGWLDAPVALIGRGPGRAPRIEVTGGVLDLRRATFGSSAGTGGSSADSGPLIMALERLQVTDEIALTQMRGTFSTQNGLDGAFSAGVNGASKVDGRVLPQNGRSAIRITAEDAGQVFAAAGVLKQARGGALSLTLLPVGEGDFNGNMTVTNTRIQDAPAIGALLNALSIVGLLEQLNGSGIHFSEVEAEFRLSPSEMTLIQASAVGPSMGISMDGKYAVDTGLLDMQGVISPIYLLNGIGSVFTRKGEGLIGFNYGLKGSAASPSVSVNPLSALTPGFLREIFRDQGPVPEDVKRRREEEQRRRDAR